MTFTNSRVSAAVAVLFAALVAAAPAPAKRGLQVFGPFNETAWAIEHGATDIERRNLDGPDGLAKRGAWWGDFGEFDGDSSAKFTDGQGTYIRSGDDARYGGPFGLHCWTDLFYVTSHVEADSWRRDDTSIDCSTTSYCESHRVQSGQRCSSWNLAGSLELELTRDQMSTILGFTGTLGVTVAHEWETCTTSESANVCVWDDKLCHTVWRSDLTLVHEGYIRRRCADGPDSTRWMHDVQIKQPVQETRIGCAATCDMNSYPFPVPAPPANQ